MARISSARRHPYLPYDDIVEETNLGEPDKEKSTFEKLLFHVELKPRDKDGKAETVIKKLHVSFRNEW